MTFVRVRLALDRLAVGHVLLVALSGAEPRENVPKSAEALGHDVLRTIDDGAVSRVWIRKR